MQSDEIHDELNLNIDWSLYSLVHYTVCIHYAVGSFLATFLDFTIC